MAVARGRDRAEGPPGRDRLLPTLDRDRAERLVAHAAQRRGVRRGTDDDLVGPGDLLQPARGVHDVAHRGVVAAGTQRADEHLAGVHADPQVDVDPVLVAHLGEPFLHAQRGAHRALGVVLVRDRRAEERDERVADDLVDLAAERGDLGREALEAVGRRGS